MIAGCPCLTASMAPLQSYERLLNKRNKILCHCMLLTLQLCTTTPSGSPPSCISSFDVNEGETSNPPTKDATRILGQQEFWGSTAPTHQIQQILTQPITSFPFFLRKLAILFTNQDCNSSKSANPFSDILF